MVMKLKHYHDPEGYPLCGALREMGNTTGVCEACEAIKMLKHAIYSIKMKRHGEALDSVAIAARGIERLHSDEG